MSKDSCNLSEVTKTINKSEQDVPVRARQKIEHTSSKLYENKGRA